MRRTRWLFARVSGRRRIGKTALIQQALRSVGPANVLYVQIPDSAPAGVLSAVADAMDTFGIDACFRRPTTLLELAQTIGVLARAGFIITLDGFQYFSRKVLHEFTSHLQAVVDELSRDAAVVPGGLFVLGSLHTELVALLDDRDAPLYNRATDHIEVGHLDIASILAILREHADVSPMRCTEAENWFLSELRGRYEERSRKGLGDFALTERIQGYWDRRDIEIDLVAIDENTRAIRFGTCKRSADKLLADLENCRRHIARFMDEHRRFADWQVQEVAIAPQLEAKARADIQARGFLAQDLQDLTAGL